MGEKSEFAVKSSIAALQERALDIIASRPEGIYQSDLRRLLEIDSSKCSKVVSRLQGSDLIRRDNVPASSTYLIKLSPDFASSTATAISAAQSTVPAPNGQEEETETGNEEVKKKQAAGKLDGGIFKANADAQMNGYNADATSAIMKSDLESLIQSNDDGRIKRMIDRQIERLIDRRISGQLNSRIQCSIGRIEDAIKSKTESNADGKRSSEEDLDLGGRIIGYFDSQRFPDRQGHIDSYLTEIYLLYLTRAASF